MGTVRTLRRRLALFAALAGLLVQAALGVPASVRLLAVAGPICTVSHTVRGSSAPLPVPHDHAHCLLCHPGAGPPLPSFAAVLAPPASAPWAAPRPAIAALHLLPAPIGFSSRAPPALA